MEEIILDGKKFTAEEVKVYEAPIHGKNEIKIVVKHTAIALYQISQLYWKRIIFDVVYQGKTYTGCTLPSMKNANGIASEFTAIISY